MAVAKEKISKILKTGIKASGAALRIIVGIGAAVLTIFTFKKNRKRK